MPFVYSVAPKNYVTPNESQQVSAHILAIVLSYLKLFLSKISFKAMKQYRGNIRGFARLLPVFDADFVHSFSRLPRGHISFIFSGFN